MVKKLSLYAITLGLALPLNLLAPKAPSALDKGPNNIATTEYRLPATLDTAILADRKTEIWARVFYPASHGHSSNPLIVFLHGNHGTCGTGSNPRSDNNCQYTETGTCAEGSIVTPNHEGYNYVAEHLASWGFIVISINANRGITCGGGITGDGGLNLARGRLVLKHLALLSEWGRGKTNPPDGMEAIARGIDWNKVGFVGHSRGGEGVRAAWYYTNHPSAYPGLSIPPYQLRGIYEIGSVDGQTSIQLNAEGVVWNQMLPMCDGDVSDLQGRFPYERMIGMKNEPPNAQKSLYFVWGANHNFFNTEWQTSDSRSCTNHEPIFPSSGGSPAQQLIAKNAITAFFLGLMPEAAAYRKFALNFNPLYSTPDAVLNTTRIEREFTPSTSEQVTAVFDAFDKDTGISTYGIPNRAENITVKHITTDRFQRAADIAWNHPTQIAYLESNWTPYGAGRDISAAKVLEFRVSKANGSSPINEPLDFSVELADANGNPSSRLKISSYVDIIGPGNTQRTFQTVRIPLSDFANINLKALRSVRFAFDLSPQGNIAIANIQFSRSFGVGVENFEMQRPAQKIYAGRITPSRFHSEMKNKVESIQNQFLGLHTLVNSYTGSESTEMWIESRVGFPVRDELPYLLVGQKYFSVAHYISGNTSRMAFSIPMNELKNIRSGSAMTFFYGNPNTSNLTYQIGLFDPNKKI